VNRRRLFGIALSPLFAPLLAGLPGRRAETAVEVCGAEHEDESKWAGPVLYLATNDEGWFVKDQPVGTELTFTAPEGGMLVDCGSGAQKSYPGILEVREGRSVTVNCGPRGWRPCLPLNI
jgi:hypothetical protein